MAEHKVGERGCRRYHTLSPGKRATPFWVRDEEDGITLYTGSEGRTSLKLSRGRIDELLTHFKDRGWFMLGNGIDDIKPGGLGEYFRVKLKASPKFASHLAALLVQKGRLEHRYGERSRVELRVVRGSSNSGE